MKQKAVEVVMKRLQALREKHPQAPDQQRKAVALGLASEKTLTK